MRVLVGALVLLLCAWRTHERAPDWRSDEAISRAAVRSSPTRPRPALNVAIAVTRLGRWDEAEHWTQRAADLMTPRDEWMRPHLCQQINRLSVLVPEPRAFSVECAY